MTHFISENLSSKVLLVYIVTVIQGGSLSNWLTKSSTYCSDMSNCDTFDLCYDGPRQLDRPLVERREVTSYTRTTARRSAMRTMSAIVTAAILSTVSFYRPEAVRTLVLRCVSKDEKETKKTAAAFYL